MNTSQTIQERASYDVGVYPQDVGTADVTGGTFYDMKGFGRAAAVGISAQAADTETFTVQLMQATDASGTSAKTLGTAVTATATSANEVLEALQEAKASDMDTDNDFTFIGAQLSSSETGLVGTATLIRADGSYRP